MTDQDRDMHVPVALHPGEHLRDYLEAQELSQSDFAVRAGVSEKHVSQILSGKAGIGPQMALAIERVLGGGAGMWLNIDTAYRLAQVRNGQHRRNEEQLDWVREFPLKDLRKRGFVRTGRVSPRTVDEVLSFFAVADVEEWEQVYAAPAGQFRRSPAYQASWKAQATYLRICELRADVWDLEPFRGDRVREIVTEVRRNMHGDPRDVLEGARSALSGAGVALVVEPAVEKSRLSGAAFWPRRNKAVMALTLRFKTADQLFFSFFHEAGHLLLHRDRLVLETETSAGELEHEANQFARDVLVPQAAYQELVAQGRPSREHILEFARKHELPVDSLIGMLQHDRIIAFKELNEYKRSISVNEVADTEVR